ncbi:MAG: ATP-dependent DNA helicase [Planctomycetes bacterium]|nr:ATP-dependent DNA helicase [Planctomycetota bacterium]
MFWGRAGKAGPWIIASRSETSKRGNPAARWDKLNQAAINRGYARMLASTDPVFLICETTGPDPVRDRVTRLEAKAYPEGEGVIELLSHQEFAADESGGLMEIAIALEKLAGRPLILPKGQDEFLSRFRELCPEQREPTVLDLSNLATLLHPRRGEIDPEALFRRFVRDALPRPWRASDSRTLLESMVRAHFDRAEPLRQLLARSLEELQVACGESDVRGYEWLEFARRLMDRPSRYAAGNKNLERAPLADGRFGEDLEFAPLDADRLIREIAPEFLAQYQLEFEAHEPLESRLDNELGLHPEDAPIFDTFFDSLPNHFAHGSEDLATERPAQRALGHAVEETLASSGFLLADAPTGTGKTLAYLAPLLLWAQRNGVRTGLSTYTRALQEQAFFQEVPRALNLLRKAGLAEERMPRVSMLKGRSNYICGRAIGDAAPEPDAASSVSHATWMRLALFYCEDLSGDLDGFPLEPGVPLGNPARTVRTARGVVQQVRALPNCCHGRAALRCAAGIRGLRAERSHLVVTNHAFVLSRPEYFSHILFDECDHLHEVALSVRSFEIELDEVTALAQSLQTGRGRDRAPLERLHRLLNRLTEGDKSEALQEQGRLALDGTRKLDASGFEVARELRSFREWRDEQAADRTPEERAFLLHEYLETGRGDGLVTALHALSRAVDQLDSSLRWAIEELGEVPLRDARRLRWSLRRPLEQLGHWREGLELWLGGESGESDFSDHFHDHVVFENRRQPMLMLKWILPQQWLGSVYFPSLRNAALVSATTRLRGGFGSMRGYLGLDILTEDTIDRAGREVTEFAGPSTFDPKQALICVPEDAPPYGWRGSAADTWTEYVQDSLLYLAERTEGRVLGLFTNRAVLQRVGERLATSFRALSIPLYWQGMPGMAKEEIVRRFRAQKESVLLGLDTFWYGVDFPGETCEYVVMTKLPYGALDDYVYAQKARMGAGPHRNQIYLPKSLAMFRQGCGRLLRNERDRGAVIILDRRALEKRHADFLKELPGGAEEWQTPNLLVADTDACFEKVFEHMNLERSIAQRGLARSFSSSRGYAEHHDS